jgi:hypothetical protein
MPFKASHFAKSKMQNFFRLTILVLAIAGARAAELVAPAGTSLSTKVDAFKAAERQLMTQELSESAVAREITRHYEALHLPARQHGKIKELETSELKLSFYAANLASFYTLDKSHTTDLASYASELLSRNSLSEGDSMLVYEALIAARMLDDARRWRKRNPELLPVLVGKVAPNAQRSGRTEWVIENDSPTVTRRKASVMEKGPHILIIAHPLCHFTQYLVKAISEDPGVAAVIRERAHWMAPQQRGLDLSELQKWNVLHPDMPISITYNRAGWTAIDTWATPTMYFFRDGELMAKIVGWPTEGRRAALLDGMRKIGAYH